jgi:hypothetical protein
MPVPTDAIVAGSKPFALALFAAVTERAGARPRIAADPAQALPLCRGSTGILILEFDERWVPVLRQLRGESTALRVLAAVPPAREPAAGALPALGVETVRWDGTLGPVLEALERLLGAPPARPGAQVPRLERQPPTIGRAVLPAGAARPGEAAAPAAAAASEAGPAATDLFSDLGEAGELTVGGGGPEQPSGAVPLEAARPRPAPQPGVRAPYVPVPAAGPVAWPSGAPSVELSEELMAAAADGSLPPGSPLRPIAAPVLAALSDVERDALAGREVPVDAALLRRAAAMRLRVAVALSEPPAPGGAVDVPLVEAILAEIDAVLGGVNALLSTAPEALRPALEATRNALVKEAVDFSEVSHAATPIEGAGPESASAEVALRRPSVSGARVLRIDSAATEAAPRRRSLVLPVFLVIAALAAAGFHAYRWYQKEQLLAAMRTLPGAPERMLLVPGPASGPQLLIPLDGKLPARDQVERFKAQQSLRGFTVVEQKGGALMVTPEQREEGRTP